MDNVKEKLEWLIRGKVRGNRIVTRDRPKSNLSKIKVSANYYVNYLPNKSRKMRSIMKGRRGGQAGIC